MTLNTAPPTVVLIDIKHHRDTYILTCPVGQIRRHIETRIGDYAGNPFLEQGANWYFSHKSTFIRVYNVSTLKGSPL